MKLFSHILIIIFLSLLPFVYIFTNPNLPHTSDGEVQIPRMAAFYRALADKHIPVRWAGELNYGYGMPLFNFIYHTPFYFSSLLIKIGFSLTSAFKALLFISFIFSGIGMFLFSRNFFKNNTSALFTSIIFQFAPYHLIDILTRGAIGTIFVYSFFPFILWGFTLLDLKKFSLKINLFIISIFTALMILSHNSIALIFFVISLLYVLIFIDGFLKKLLALYGLMMGLFLSAFYWIPAIFEHKFTYGDLFMKDLFKVNFPHFWHFFIPNPLNLENYRVSEVAVNWGITHTLMILAALFLIFRWKKISILSKKIIIFNGILIIGSVFLMNKISMPIWESTSFLRQFQFPWRLLSVIIFATSFLGGLIHRDYLIKRNILTCLLILITILCTAFYWNPTQGFDKHVSDDYFWNYPLNTTYFGETDVIWSAGPATKYPKSRIEVIEGQAKISNIVKKNHIQLFQVDAESETRLVSHTQFFPGWRIYRNNEKIPIEFQDQNWRGLITFKLPKGVSNIRIQFEETPIRFIANLLSISMVMFEVLYLLFNIFYKLYKLLKYAK